MDFLLSKQSREVGAFTYDKFDLQRLCAYMRQRARCWGWAYQA